MSLTKDDLVAIKNLIDSSIDERVPAIVEEKISRLVPPIVEKYVEAAKRQTAAGISELHENVGRVEDKIDEIAQIQKAEVERVDVHDKTITRMRRALRVA